jgi:CheY-like chemotaxis protein
LRFSTAVLVEDSPGDAALFIETAKAAGHTSIVWYQSGTRFLKDLPLPEIPTAIIVDLNMPGCDGFDVMRVLRRSPELAAIPVVVFTSSENRRDRDLAAELGAKDYVVKPTSLGDYEQIVVEIIAKWMTYCDCSSAFAAGG